MGKNSLLSKALIGDIAIGEVEDHAFFIFVRDAFAVGIVGASLSVGGQYVMRVTSHNNGNTPRAAELQNVLVELSLALEGRIRPEITVVILDFKKEILSEVIRHLLPTLIRIFV